MDAMWIRTQKQHCQNQAARWCSPATTVHSWKTFQPTSASPTHNFCQQCPPTPTTHFPPTSEAFSLSSRVVGGNASSKMMPYLRTSPVLRQCRGRVMKGEETWHMTHDTCHFFGDFLIALNSQHARWRCSQNQRMVTQDNSHMGVNRGKWWMDTQGIRDGHGGSRLSTWTPGEYRLFWAWEGPAGYYKNERGHRRQETRSERNSHGRALTQLWWMSKPI